MKLLATLWSLLTQWRAIRRWRRVGKKTGFSSCFRCSMSYATLDATERHRTYYTEALACFPLCNPCWLMLSPEQRLPYYRALVFHVWEQPETWPAVERAVLAGK